VKEASMGARRLGTMLVAAMLWAGAARAQSTGTGFNTGSGSTGSGSNTGSAGSSQQGGSTGSAGGVTFDPAAQAAARLFGVYRVPGAAPLDTTGVYRVDTGSSGAAAGSGGGGATGSTSTSTSATTNTATSGASATP
jgi:hypothetical protein